MKKSLPLLLSHTLALLLISGSLLGQCFSTQTFTAQGANTTFTVPSDHATYTIQIDATGGDGANGQFIAATNDGGSGAQMVSTFKVNGGSVLTIGVGGVGSNGLISPSGGGGGGGSVVIINDTDVLIVAAGGGGANHSDGGTGGGNSTDSTPKGGSSGEGFGGGGGGFYFVGGSNPIGVPGGCMGTVDGGGGVGGFGGFGFGGGGASAGLIGGGGGGFRGGSGGSSTPFEGGKGGDSFVNPGFQSSVVSATAGAYSAGTLSGGTVIISCISTSDDAEPFDAIISSEVPPGCAGSTNGLIYASAFGGTAPYTFTINGGSSQDHGVFEGLSDGTYFVSVSDAVGAAINLPAVNLSTGGGVPLTGTIADQTHTSCADSNDGTVLIEADGGTPDYTYSLDGGTPTSSGAFDNLGSGSYTVTIFDDSDCSTDIDFTITSPQAMTIDITDQTDITCFGDDDGTITVSASGGDGNFSYSLDGGSFGGSNTFDNLSDGSHTITVSDGQGCEESTSTSIDSPSAIEVLTNIGSPSCPFEDDGSVVLSASGGDPGYQYFLDGNSSDDGEFFSLTAGVYDVEVIDASGCTFTTTAEVVDPSEVQFLIFDTTDAICGSASGTASLEAFDGASPYEFTMNGESNSTGQFANLGPGDYLASVVDDNGCLKDLNVTIDEGPNNTSLLVDNTEDATCSTSGAAFLQAIGGQAPYTYTVDGESNENGSFLDLVAGDYSATATDFYGCLSTADFTIGEAPGDMTLTVDNSEDVTCISTGSVALSADNGAAPYTYTLGGESNDTGSFSDLTAGDYTATVDDSDGCSSTVDFTIGTVVDDLSLAVGSSQNVICNSNGAVALQASDGAGAYTYTLGGESNDTGAFSDLAAGDYSAMVTDGNGCTSTVDFAIGTTMSDLSLAVGSSQNVVCNTPGAVAVQASNGTAPYTYALGEESNDTGSFSDLAAGDYTAMVTDVNGCASTVDFAIGTAPDDLSLAVNNSEDVLCDTPGLVAVGASNGTAPYTYALGEEANDTGSFSDLVAGDYTAMVTDVNGCASTVDFTIGSSMGDVSLAVSSSQAATCTSSDGSATIAASNGLPPYTYTVGATSNDTGEFTGLPSGSYIVSVNDANGCVSSLGFAIGETTGDVTLTVESTQNTTCGSTDGTVSLTGANGTTPYVYALGGETNDTGNFANLAAGDYTATITDMNGCTSTADFSIIAEGSDLNFNNTATTSVTCPGDTNGSATMEVMGGTGNYTFSLDGGTPQDSGVFTGLAAGTYTGLVEDESGCTTTTELIVGGPDEIAFNNLAGTDALCAGTASGVINFSIGGGTEGIDEFTLVFDGMTSTVARDAVVSFDNLAAGTYMFTASNSAGCSSDGSLMIGEPNAVAVTAETVSAATCANGTDGSVDIASATGGSGNYMFTINGSSDLGNLPAGTYTLLATDDNGCTGSTEVTIADGYQVELMTTSTTDLECGEQNTGAVSLTASEGVGPYTYSLEGHDDNDTGTFESLSTGAFTANVVDVNGCTASNDFTIGSTGTIGIANPSSQNVSCFGLTDGQISVTASGTMGDVSFTLDDGTPQADGDFTDLAAGTYTVSIEDEAGCTAAEAFTITEPELLSVALSDVVNNTCFGETAGSVTLNVNGGTADYMTFFDETAVSSSDVVVSQLAAGTYTATVTDANGCTASSDVSVTEPEELSTTVESVTDVDCESNGNTGAVTLSTAGGNGPYSYTVDEETNMTGEFTELSAGVYSASIVDAMGCTTSADFEVESINNIVVESVDIVSPSCNGDSDGSFSIQAQGNGTYFYTLGITTNGTGDFDDLAANTYTVIIENEQNCITEETVIVSEPAVLSLDASTMVEVSCEGQDMGTVTVAISGGTPSYTLAYNMETVQVEEGVSAEIMVPAEGVLAFSATDANGCVVDGMVDFGVATPPLTLMIGSVTDDDGTGSGSITVDAAGGVPPFVYSIDGGASFQPENTFTDLAGDTEYMIIVQDANGCEADVTQLIVDSEELALIDAALQVFPNPAVDQVQIQLTSADFGILSVDLIDVAGRQIGSSSYSIQNLSTQHKVVNTAQLDAGTYIFRITCREGIVYRKLVLMK